MQIPIACTLTATDAIDRVDEWRTFLRDCVTRFERTDAGLRATLVEGDAVLVRAADLAAREKACCGFFTFAIEIDTDDRVLVVGAPPDAAAVLDEFAQLAEPTPS